MTFDILTLFPKMFVGPFDFSIVKRAQEKNLVKINLRDLRKYAVDERGSVDDRPYGGGAGMILRIEPIYKAVQVLNSKIKRRLKSGSKNNRIILFSTRGKKFNQNTAKRLSKYKNLIP